MKVSRRKCKVCRDWFVPSMQIQPTCKKAKCQITFASEFIEKKKQKAIAKQKKDSVAKRSVEKKQLSVRKENLKTIGYYRHKADLAFQKYCRVRDYADPCISCGRMDYAIPSKPRGGKWDGGHYLSKGCAPELRYNENNCHKQCKWCNDDLGGNPVRYRQRLILKIGEAAVLELEGPHEMTRYRKEDYKRIRLHYSRETKKLQNTIDLELNSISDTYE